MGEPEGNGGGEDFTGGTGGGGHGGSVHVLRGQPAGIGAGQLYFLVVTACVIAAIAAIWLLGYGVKWCHKICKKRSQRRVGCFPTEETSGVALNQDWTHGDICIDMDMDTGEAEPKHSSNGRKADHTVISIFDDEDEIETLPQLNGSIDGISRNSDVRIQMEEEETQEKSEEISAGTGQREDKEINKNENETHENETCQVEARTLDVAETKENLEENIQLVPALSCTILMPAIQEADEYESSSEEELKDLGNNRLPSPKYGSSNEGDMELPSSATCELVGQRKSDQDTEDDSYGGESSEEELQLSNLPGTVDYYKTIQLQQTNPRSKIIDVTKQEMESGSGSESELEGQGNQGIKDYDSSNEGSPIVAVAIEEELESRTESKNELQTSGQLTSTSGIMQQKFAAEAVDAPGTIENLVERIQLGQAMSCIILMPAIHEAEEYDSSSEDEFKELGKYRLSSPNYGSSNEGDTELPLSVTSDLEDQRESDQDTEDESCGSKSNSSVTVTSELESEQESDQDTEDESYGSNNSIEEQLLNLPETVDYYEIIQLGPTTPSTTIMDATEQETDCGSGSEFELGNQQITDYDSSNEGSSIMAAAMEEELESGTESQDECETSGQLGSTTGITQQSAEQAQPLSLGTLMNSEKKNYASSNSADDELEEEENGKMTDYESSDEASVTSSSSMTTEFGEAWEGDKEGHQLEAQASNVPEAVDNMQESTEPTRTDAGTSVMHDDDCDLGIESIFEEMESSQVIGDLLPKDMEPQKTVFTTSTGKGDQEQILKSTHFPFSVSNDNAGPFNDNQIEDVALVYTLNIDEEPPESPNALLSRESDRPLEILDGTPEIPPSSIEGTCDNPRPKRQITPAHQVKSKWELADAAVAADVPDTPSSAWQRDLKMDPDLLECAQAQCYAHQEESGGRLVIAGQLSAWWDSAVHSLTPNSIDENESSYADTVAGNVLEKRSEEKTEIAVQKDNDGSPSEGMNSDEENSKAFEKGQGLNDATSQSKDQVYENLADKSSE